MKAKQTVVLVAIVAVMVAAYLLYIHPWSEEEAVASKRVFGGVRADAITRVKLSVEDRVLSLEKRGEEWFIIEPLQVKASSSAVQAILSELEMLEPDRRITPQEDPEFSPAKYGLDRPTATVSFATKDRAFELNIGGKSPTGLYYAAPADAEDLVMVLPSSFYDTIDREPNDLRDRRPFVFEDYAVRRIRLQSAKEAEPFVFERDAEGGTWRIRRPVDGRAEQRNVNNILRTLLQVAVLDFASDDPAQVAEFGLDKPALTVTLEDTRGEHTLKIGTHPQRPRQVYAQVADNPTIFRIDDRLLAEIDKPLMTYRDRRLFHFRAQDVDRVVVEYSGMPTTELVLRAGEWKMLKPREEPTRTVAVTALLGTLESAEIVGWASESAENLQRWGLDRPAMQITLHLTDGSTRTLQIGQRVAEGSSAFYARRPDEAPVITVSSLIYEAADQGYLKFLTWRLLNLDVADAVRLEIHDRDGREVVCERIGPDQWQVIRPFTLKADLANVNDVLIRIATLQCFGYTTDDLSTLTEHGLEPPLRTVSVDFRSRDPEGGEAIQRYSLRIGNIAQEHYNQAHLEGGRYIFMVNRDIYRESSDEMVTLQIFKAEPDTIRQIDFIYPDQTVSMERTPEGWRISQPETREADADLVREVLAKTESVSAVGYADYAPEDLAKYGLDAPAFRLRLTREDGLTSELWVGGQPAADTFYAKDRDGEPVFLLPKALVEQLQKRAPDLEVLPVLRR